MRDRNATTRRGSGYRWAVLAMCWAVFTMTSVDRSAWGPASPAVGKSLAVPLAALGVFATGYYLGYVISNAAGGFLNDRFGPRRVLGFSGLGAGTAMILFGTSTSFAFGLALQAIVGLFAGVDYSGGMKSIAEWFDEKERGLAVSLFLTALSLGTIIANAVVPRLVEGGGWQNSYRLFGAITVALSLLALVLIRPGPERAGPVRTGRPKPLEGLRHVVTNRNLLLVCAAGFGALWGDYGFVTWANNLLIHGLQIDGEHAATIMIIFAAMSLVVKPAIGLLIRRRRINLPRFAVVTLAFFTAALIGFGFAVTYTQAVFLAVLLGIGAYAYSPLLATLTQTFAKLDFVGTAAGTINAVWQLGSVIVPVVVGAVFAATGSFPLAFVALAVGPALGVVAGCFIRQPGQSTADLPATAPKSLLQDS
ncbi:MFS transporter [Streptomyces sp. NPDC006372]|uniref:MFS transporter n=1 Tax=Streptomyces sp. NPDC006372 TaxID=3155599 RepID=UPI0033A1C4C7